jgi:predicted dehydrogenase/threonine dehydrogenase-like Zn-dependent dehydrogenase
MKQVTQRLRNGRIEIMDVPPPVLGADGVLVDVRASLLSAGTERSTVEAARASLIGKARARPEQARQVLDKARRDGIKTTLEAVRTRLDQPSPLGYSSAGVVIAVGERVADLRVGTRVACAGGGFAVHAELSYVPGNLCVPIPDGVSFEEAAFSTVGSIALQGVRQAAPQIGERVAVIGLGLVGQLTCRILRAAGCHVVGIDVVGELVDRARQSGAVAEAMARADLEPDDLPEGVGGCDSIIITAATSSDDPVRLAGALARDRARVVIVGDVGVSAPRSSYYGKELELRFSRSYGPGRYDREYEERGLDYPIGYVRWTERRNLDAFVGLLGDGRLAVEDLITARTPIEEAAGAYERLVGGERSPLGLILTYAETPLPPIAAVARNGGPARAPRRHGATPAAGVIGAGSFSQRLLIPSLREAGFSLTAVASANGLSANSAVERFGFTRATTPDELLAADDLDVVCVASRHGSHADYATRALARGAAVFCEKPPALTATELEALREAARGQVLQVGFNRRHAPLAMSMREHVVRGGHPVELIYRVAAGRLPADHWLNDPGDGGGRLLGEGCHFVDFACWFVGSLPTAVAAAVPDSGVAVALEQRFAITLTFAGGSLATIFYGSEADGDFSKELVEAHSAGRSAVLHDYKSLELRGGGRPRTINDRRQDKGHRAQFVAFRQRLDGDPGTRPDPLDTMAVTLEALATARGE